MNIQEYKRQKKFAIANIETLTGMTLIFCALLEISPAKEPHSIPIVSINQETPSIRNDSSDSPLPDDTQQTDMDQLTLSILSEVESICKRSKTLEAAGKETLSQSATLLDFGESTLPVLLKTLNNRKKNWKMRYWITDLLGYVGNKKTVYTLLKIAGNEKEIKEIRLRALDSLLELQRRNNTDSELLNWVKKKLRKLGKQTQDQKIRRKIQATLSKMKRKT